MLRRVIGPVYWRPLEDFMIARIQPHAYLVAFWKNLDNGIGPGFSLYVYDQEVLRYDCFGGEAGHYHVMGLSGGAIVAPLENISRKRQVEQSIADLPSASLKYLSAHCVPRIRAFKLDNKKADEVSEQVQRWMLEVLDRSPQLETAPLDMSNRRQLRMK
jgi:hypothetical protein